MPEMLGHFSQATPTFVPLGRINGHIVIFKLIDSRLLTPKKKLGFFSARAARVSTWNSPIYKRSELHNQ